MKIRNYFLDAFLVKFKPYIVFLLETRLWFTLQIVKILHFFHLLVVIYDVLLVHLLFYLAVFQVNQTVLGVSYSILTIDQR